MFNKVRRNLYFRIIMDREITIKKISKIMKKIYNQKFVKAIYYTEYIRCRRFIKKLEILENQTELPTDIIGKILINYLIHDF